MERNISIMDLVLNGETLQSVAGTFGISAPNVRRIVYVTCIKLNEPYYKSIHGEGARGVPSLNQLREGKENFKLPFLLSRLFSRNKKLFNINKKLQRDIKQLQRRLIQCPTCGDRPHKHWKFCPACGGGME